MTQIARAVPVLEEPKDLTVKDWEARRRTALEAYELGKRTMEPGRLMRPPLSQTSRPHGA